MNSAEGTENGVELLEALKNATRALSLLVDVNMQTRNDLGKLGELADCRLEAKRILPELKSAIAKAEAKS